jgi:aminoglycoside/choline kinase family phosphotransferase/dTDP-glucose pyrophosphorylase
MKALILAAGLGTRLRPFTEHTPKALFTINRQPLLGLAIQRLERAGFQAVIVNTHHHYAQVERYVDEARFNIPVQVSREPEILGTGGAVRNIAGSWDAQPLLIVNVDIVCDIDLAQIYRFHLSHDFPVTMVMHDRAEFNSVCVDADAFVTRFDCRGQSGAAAAVMAFTGIHVIDRRVLDFLPPQGPAHIIDAYSRMLSAGERIKACVVTGHYWQDIGTPQSYRATVFDQMAPLAFEAAFEDRPDLAAVQSRSLHGDGSDRRWFRLQAGSHSLIMADHGLRTARGPQEVDAYVAIGRHLRAKGIAVPRIYLYDNLAGLVFAEDFGDQNLQALIGRSDQSQRVRLYRRVIDQWIAMALEGAKEFDPAWTFQTARYDRQVILDRECRYFVEAFVQGYLGWRLSYEDLRTEFESLADRILATEISGFLHRDFQSRNVMVHKGRLAIIDFQGGRLGPIQYDLASLLIDPYTALAESFQIELRNWAAAALAKRCSLDTGRFLNGYGVCAVSRNLQILGAFAFLSRAKGKSQFARHIPRAAQSLVRNLRAADIDLPRLAETAVQIAAHCAQLPCGPAGQKV